MDGGYFMITRPLLAGPAYILGVHDAVGRAEGPEDLGA
jgi:hypothetical protein